MKQTKGAIGNLLNRYRAVLKKCHLLNTFGSLAVAGMLVMGGAGVAGAQSLPDTLNSDITLGDSNDPYFVTDGTNQILDLNGYQITTDSSIFENSPEDQDAMIVVKRGSSLTINDTSGTSGAISGDNIMVAIKVTGTEDSQDDDAAIAELIVNGGTIKGSTYGIAGNGNRHNTYIEINGGNINGNTAIYHPQDGEMVITGGTITGNKTGIELRSGKLTITGGEITGNGIFHQDPNGNGTTTDGAALAISQHTTNKNIDVTISGGKFTGYYAVVENDLHGSGENINLNIIDGEFDGKIYSKTVENFITGGTFTDPTALHYLGEGANVQVNLKNNYSYSSEKDELNADKTFEIEENRTVNMDLDNHTFELTKEGNTSAGNVNIANGTLSLQSDLTLTGGVFDITEATLKNTDKANLQISAGGALNMTTGQVVEESFVGATLDSGGIVNLEGTEVDAAILKTKFGTEDTGSETINGIVNATQGMTVTGIFDQNPTDGKIAYEKVNVWGIADDTTKSTVVTNVGSGNQVKGGWQAIELKSGTEYAQVGGTLQLAGTPDAAKPLIVKGDGTGEAADLRIGSKKWQDYTATDTTVIFGDLEQANQGTIGNITMNAGANHTANLFVYGNDQTKAHFTADDIKTSNDINALETVTVQGAKFTVDSIATNGGQPLDKMGIIDGLVVVGSGNANLKDVFLANGTLQATQTPATEEGAEATGGNISISGNLSGSGTVDAEDTLTLTAHYQGAAADSLSLKAGNKIAAQEVGTYYDLKKADGGRLDLDAPLIAAKDIDATNITANKIWAAAVTVDGGNLSITETEELKAPSTVASLTLENGASGTINATLNLKNDNGIVAVGTGAEGEAGSSLSVRDIDLKGGMLLASSDWGQTAANAAVENLTNGSVGVGQNAYVALGTMDRDWLPKVAGALSETGTTAVLGIYNAIKIAENEAIVVDGKLTGNNTTPEGTLGHAVSNTTYGATFAANTMLVVNGKNVYGDTAAITFNGELPRTISVDKDAKLQITDVMEGQSYIIVDNATLGEGVADLAGWQGEIETNTDMITVAGVTYDEENKRVITQESKLQDAHKVFPDLSDEMAGVVNDLYTTRTDADGTKRLYANPESKEMGIRFLSRATDKRYLGGDHAAAASTIESAARMAFAGAVPQMTKMASDSATNSVVNRMGFANPENGAKAMNVDGKLVDDKALGLALWIAPLWSNQTGFGMEAGNLDYGYNANIGGISLGADYTWANNFRAGLMFNIGGGYAESSGDLSETTNSMTFWGVGAYGGWKYENFAVMGDVSYTSTWNSVDQDVDHRMEMGDLEADIQASAISAGLRFEYKLETQYLDLIPHVGARYMSINTWGYDVETNGGTVMEGDGFQQNIWTFPVGITFSKELEMNNDWYFKPSVDFTVIPAAGDIKAKEDVRFTGLPYSTEIETQMMDYFTWQGGLGLEFGNDNMSVGVNYTLQAGQNSTGHGVFGMFRYEF